MRIGERIIQELLGLDELCPHAKMTYLAAMMYQPDSLRSLGAIIGLEQKTAAKHTRELERAGWMRPISESGRLRPLPTVPPHVEAKLAHEWSCRIDMSQDKALEATKAFLDWIVAPTVQFYYGAGPKFLVNPETGKRMQYHIYVPDYNWAVELRGGGDLRGAGSPSEAGRLRDSQTQYLLKVGGSKSQGVRLSIFTRGDLSLSRILREIPDDIPRREYDKRGPFVQNLENIGRACGG